jgi:hypothetical protein
MKKQIIRVTGIFLCVTLLFGCKNSAENQKDKNHDAVNEKRAGLKSKSEFGGQVVPAELANECINAYYLKYKNLSGKDTVISDGQLTMNVGFEFPSLQYWINNLTSNPDQLKVCFGVYTKNYVNSLVPEHPELVGRLTVFLWPYKAEVPIQQYYRNILKKPLRDGDGDPYNLGELKP